ncbi:MAG: hypothetical protein OXE79_08635 [Acidimicrobiaceae bacterium]|nr:hypothetical protein [Acidimicrobiaceae bacterium]
MACGYLMNVRHLVSSGTNIHHHINIDAHSEGIQPRRRDVCSGPLNLVQHDHLSAH